MVDIEEIFGQYCSWAWKRRVAEWWGRLADWERASSREGGGPKAVLKQLRGLRTISKSKKQYGKRRSLYSAQEWGSQKITCRPWMVCFGSQGSFIGREQTALGFGRDSWNWYFGICFSPMKNPWLTITRLEIGRQAYRPVVCKLLIILILLCATKYLSLMDQSHYHPFKAIFNLHEVMPFLLHSAEFRSSPFALSLPHILTGQTILNVLI